MDIKQLLARPEGKKNRGGGFQVTLKRARGVKPVGKKYLQEVVLEDFSGEIQGDILLEKRIPLQSSMIINVIVCWIQHGEKGPKLYVEQWSHTTITADEQYDKRKDFRQQMFDPEEEYIVKSKVRMHLVEVARHDLGFRGPLSQMHKQVIESDIEYIMTGE